MPAAKCGACAKYLSPLGAARCSACKALFHRACGSLPPSGYVAPSWSCPDCTNKIIDPKVINTTPEIAICSSESTDSLCYSGNPTSDISNMLYGFKEELRGELRQMLKEEFVLIREEFLGEFQRLRTDLTQLQTERDQLKESINTLTERLDSMDVRMITFEQNLAPLKATEEVAQLRRELNDRDQQLLSNDLEITNMPETSNENLTHTVKLIATKLGVRIEERDIVSADRVGGVRVNATNAAGAMETRPRPIVVRLARRDLRDELMRAARVRRGASTADLNIPGPPRRFYVNERLTKINRQLFRRAREVGQRLGWKFIWTKHGRILARLKPEDKANIIRHESDLQRVFGPDTDKVPQK